MKVRLIDQLFLCLCGRHIRDLEARIKPGEFDQARSSESAYFNGSWIEIKRVYHNAIGVD